MSAKRKKKDAEEKPEPYAGPVQPPNDPELMAALLEQTAKGVEQIDVFPLDKRGDPETRLYTISVAKNEAFNNERANEVATRIESMCQIHCDRRRKKGVWNYRVVLSHSQRGGFANPVASPILALEGRAQRPAPEPGADVEDQDEGLSARKMLLESVGLIHTKDKTERENEGTIVGETLIVLKGALVDRELLITKLFDKNIEMAGKNAQMVDKFLEMAKVIGERHVEAEAVKIDAANAADQREENKARRQRENMFTNVLEAGMLEGVKQLGSLFPDLGKMFLSRMMGTPMPDVPQLGGGTPALPTNAPPAVNAVPEEIVLVKKFIAAIRARKMDDGRTAEECLFGKDDDAGNPIAPGVFDRAQVAILSGVNTGTLGVEALDALLPDSNKPEAIRGDQLARAMPYFTPSILDDVWKFLKLRKDAQTNKEKT